MTLILLIHFYNILGNSRKGSLTGVQMDPINIHNEQLTN